MAFSHDGTMLAIAQSDNIVFVYKIGADWYPKNELSRKAKHTLSIRIDRF